MLVAASEYRPGTTHCTRVVTRLRTRVTWCYTDTGHVAGVDIHYRAIQIRISAAGHNTRINQATGAQGAHLLSWKSNNNWWGPSRSSKPVTLRWICSFICNLISKRCCLGLGSIPELVVVVMRYLHSTTVITLPLCPYVPCGCWLPVEMFSS